MADNDTDKCTDNVNMSWDDYTSFQEDPMIITIIVLIILCLGVFNNSAFLNVIFRVPTMRSATNIYLVHLALADLLYLIVTSIVYNILTASSLVADTVILKNSAECFIFGLLKNTGYFASIALVTTVSFERYLAVCHPIKHLKIRGRRRTNTMVAVCWVVGLIFACSTTLGTSAIIFKQCVIWSAEHRTELSYCSPLNEYAQYFTIPLTTVPWFIAVIANVFMYVKIIKALNKRRSAPFLKGKHHKALQSRNKVAKLLIVNGLIFFICQTPSIVVSINVSIHVLSQKYTDTPVTYILYSKGKWFSNLPLLINTIVNPLIYGAIHAQYRSAFIQAFRCNTGSSRPQLDNNIPPVSPHVMRRARNSIESKTNVTML